MNKKNVKIGFFGITANPPHKGHLNALLRVCDLFDEVWVSVSFIHPFSKPNMASYNHRLKMAQKMFNGIKNLKVVEIDKKYFNETNSTPYTFNLLNFISQGWIDGYENCDVSLIIGNDNLKKEVWSKFYENESLSKNFNIVALKDEGEHSTDIRNQLLRGEIPSSLSKDVYSYIKENNLYVEGKGENHE